MQTENQIPWYRRVKRWGQINITEDNAGNFDIEWWRKYWKRTRTQGIVLNAGGIIAYYPSKVPLHRPAQFLGANDVFGDLCKAAHEDGLVVFARMDSGKTHEEFYRAHPDWFAVDIDGKPYKYQNKFFVTCINGPYYSQHIPAILKEIATLYKPEGITDNSWEGLDRESPCYCENCRKSFRQVSGKDIPRIKDWNDPIYLEWINWNYARRLEQWDFNNKVTRSAGGPDCTWSGMISSSISGQTRGFCNLKEICKRADIIMIDAQSRSNPGGFQQNADTGKRIHGLVGWDKVVAESMAIYGPRMTTKPLQESHMWMVEGFAGGIAPWWHTISGYHEDRRRYHTVEPIFQWHEANEEFLFDRSPFASVGVVWSEENTNYFGRDQASDLVDLPTRGISQALVRARIPFIPVNADHIDRDGDQLSLLILPNIGAMTDDQVSSIRRFVEKGGGLIATGESTLYNEKGVQRKDYALGDLFGAHWQEQTKIKVQELESGSIARAGRINQTYLRLTPELRGKVDGPMTGEEPPINGERHQVLQGFEDTDIIPFGSLLGPVKCDSGTQVLLTYIPVMPTDPPENAFMREPKTDIQALILNTTSSGSRVAFMPADIDRQFANNNLPDHGDLLANLIRWTSKDTIPLNVEGAGLIDCNIYKQSNRLILHVTNLISAGTWRASIDEYIPIGPLTFRIKLPSDVTGKNLQLLVTEEEVSGKLKDGWYQFRLNSILNHEVVVIS